MDPTRSTSPGTPRGALRGAPRSFRPRPRGRRPALALPLLLGALLGLASGCAQEGAGDGVRLEPLVSGLDRPLGTALAPGLDDRLYVVEQSGRVLRAPLGEGGAEGAVFLDLSDRTRAEGERGLLGFAFAPGFPEDARVFASYTDLEGDSVLASYPAAPDGSSADPAGERVLLRVEQPYANHNGGHVAFGPDGMLYLGLGDGGSGGDPRGNGQDPSTLLGSLLRLDVSPEATAEGRPYAVPGDNPFVGRDDARPEIWVWGLRNPWRFSFDPTTGDLWIGDVGQNAVEEIDLLPGGGEGGENLGWNAVEGDRCFERGCDLGAYVAPVATYGHGPDGRSVTGGVVARGGLPELEGAYLFGDFASGRVWALRPAGGGWERELLLETGFPVSSFGTLPDGTPLVVDYRGAVLRLTAP